MLATDNIHGETHRAQELLISEPRINDRIRVPEVRLVGPGGEQVGVVPLKDALRLAEDAELDLVEVAPNAKPPVCKLMDYGTSTKLRSRLVNPARNRLTPF